MSEHLTQLPHTVAGNNYSPTPPRGEFAQQPNVLTLHHQAQEVPISDFALLDEHGLVARLAIGEATINLYAVKDEFGYVQTDQIKITHANYDPTKDDGLTNAPAYLITKADPMAVLGRTMPGSNELGINDYDLDASRKHAQVGFNEKGNLIVDDHSTNGTGLEVAINLGSKLSRTQLKAFGALALETKLPRRTAEFSVGSKQYTIDAVNGTSEGARLKVMLSSRDEMGKSRRLMVYKSQSEGSLRVTQGRDDDVYLKGAGHLSEFEQYTQDTQLNPDFAISLEQAMAVLEDSYSVKPDVELSKQEAIVARADYAEQQTVYQFGDKELANLLRVLKPGALSEKAINTSLNAPKSEKRDAKMSKHIAKLNEALLKSDYIPEFDIPKRVEADEHPILGAIKREVYEKAGVEWYMASDATGRVWIDRVRIAGSEPNAYGTDKQMLFSGILTSKPMDYDHQVTGLSNDVKTKIPGTYYTDISAFLDQLAPIQRYRHQRNVTRN